MQKKQVKKNSRWTIRLEFVKNARKLENQKYKKDKDFSHIEEHKKLENIQ